MAKAYATFATGGMRHEAVAVTKIVDKNGNVVYEAPTSDEGERVISEEVAGAVGFLVSPDAGYITGEVIAVNGGLYT